ncbi:MAG TPA: dTMP kinase, partial [Burkholderiaceae bacterium]|nr:dTMP kinase [Burkholderiaceae bacterium]
MPIATRGRFITFEGIDGAGKSTQIDAIVQTLQTRGIAFVRTREPGGTALGESLRSMMLGQPMDALAETLLMFAARRQHVLQVIEPALANARWVLCDRFTDASYAYQGAGRGVPTAQLDALASWVHHDLKPDLTVLVDLDPTQAQLRREGARTSDRFETEPLHFFERVRAAYLARAA